MTSAPNPSTVFVGSYAPAGSPGIQAFAVDERGFTKRGEFAGIANPSFLALHPDGDVLYAVSETGVGSDGISGSVHALTIAGTGEEIRFTPFGQRPSGGDHPCHVAVHPDGHTLVVVNYSGGMVTAYPLATDGTIGEAAPSFEHSGSGPNPHRQEGPHPHSSIFSPDGRFLIVADLGIDRLLVHRVTGPGELTNAGAMATTPGSGPRHMAFHPDGAHLFVVSELDNTLTVCAFDAAGGHLRPIGVAPTVPPAASGNTAADVQVGPGGRDVYVSNRGDDSIAHLVFDDDGLHLAAVSSCGGSWPRSFAVTTEGTHFVVANRRSDAVTLMSARGHREAEATMSSPSCVALRSTE